MIEEDIPGVIKQASAEIERHEQDYALNHGHDFDAREARLDEARMHHQEQFGTQASAQYEARFAEKANYLERSMETEQDTYLHHQQQIEAHKASYDILQGTKPLKTCMEAQTYSEHYMKFGLEHLERALAQQIEYESHKTQSQLTAQKDKAIELEM